MATPNEILDFWIDQVGPKQWYVSSEALDNEIIERFGETWSKGATGALASWGSCPTNSLALIILLDQFPRNMFRGSAKAFSSDRKALCYAKQAILKGYDLRAPEPQRQFFYLPLMHSESLTDQERCIRLMTKRMPETGAQNVRAAKVHREIIRKFGRFPYRNDALSRATTGLEVAYLAAGGYAETARHIQA